MSRKKHPEHVNHERWLVSYADFVTLLFAFFVVLFASGQTDKRKQMQLATSLQSAFNQTGIFDAHSKVPPLTETPAAAAPIAPAPLSLPLPGMDQAMVVVKQRINDAAIQEIRHGAISLHETEGGGLVVSIQEAGFFDSGSAEIRPSALPVLERIAAALPGSGLRVEGHTDDVPISTPQFASNWELSSARACSIARLLLGHPNVHPDKVSVAGYAAFRPVASNATPEGRERNRRVDIVVLGAAH